MHLRFAQIDNILFRNVSSRSETSIRNSDTLKLSKFLIFQVIIETFRIIQANFMKKTYSCVVKSENYLFLSRIALGATENNTQAEPGSARVTQSSRSLERKFGRYTGSLFTARRRLLDETAGGELTTARPGCGDCDSPR